MLDTQANPRSYLRLMGLVSLLGMVSALITFIFIETAHLGANLLWEHLQPFTGLDPRLFTLIVCTIGGLLVGLLVKLFGDHSGILAEVMREFGKNGRFDYTKAPGILATSFISLVFGASLGPEAALADACGGIGTWIADRLHLDEKEMRTLGYSGVSGMLAAFLTAPLGGAVLALESSQSNPDPDKKEYFWILFPSLLSSACATFVFVMLSGGFFQTLYKFPEYVPRLRDLLYAIPLGLIGGLTGMLFIEAFKWMQVLFRPMKRRVVLRGVIGGIGMGIIGALLPLTLYSGEKQIIDLMTHAAQIGALMLVTLALAKLFATTLLLATGWKGGNIFPILFVCVALGQAVQLFFPDIPVAVAVAATMAGTLVIALRSPLFAAFFTLALVQKETAAVIAVSVVASTLLTQLLFLWLTRWTKKIAKVKLEMEK